MSNNIDVLLVGTGGMAAEYLSVLREFPLRYEIVGNGRKSVTQFNEKYNEHAHEGGIENFVKSKEWLCPSCAIVAVDALKTYEVAKCLLENGVKKILLEKPAVSKKLQLNILCELADKIGAKVYVAYNRRFFSSVREAKKLIEEDGGLHSVHFEFTEWADVICKVIHSEEVKQKLFLMNSTHVVDLVFYLAGVPRDLNSRVCGSLEWHNAGAIFTGCGITEKGVVFSYNTNWDAPGRWGVELLTSKHRIYLRPLEKLQLQNIGSLEIRMVDIEDELDCKFKPGLYEEVRTFLGSLPEENGLCTINEQKEHMAWYEKISGEKY